MRQELIKLLKEYKDKLKQSDKYLKSILKEYGCESEQYEVEWAYNLSYQNFIKDLEKIVTIESNAELMIRLAGL